MSPAPSDDPLPDAGSSDRVISLAVGVTVLLAAVLTARTLQVHLVLVSAGAALAAAAGSLLVQNRRLSHVETRLAESLYEARRDPGTGLLNRTGVVEDLEQRLRRRRPSEVVGVLFLDLDRLQAINDCIGHGAGDEVVETVAARVADAVRPGDSVGRLGGDDFVVITSGLRSLADLGRLARRILDGLAQPIALGDGSRQVVTGSIGIAYVLKADASPQDLLRDADLAVYRAKQGGPSGYVVFDDELRAAAVARLELERELRRAVTDGQLAVQYQPVVTTATGLVDQVEALVRWRHPSRGLIPPGQFLSVASESGLIVELGHQVLSTACTQAAWWSLQVGRPIAVAVNLAERQLVEPSLVDTVAQVLAATGLPPAQLVLDISEELLAQRPQPVLAVLRQLRSLGVRLALDDFGAARASLAQLRGLEMISTLKLDRSLVADVATGPVDRQIVAAVVALARSLDLAVVAEGVEDADQLAVLDELGVPAVQGFFLQRPDEADAITELLDGVVGRTAVAP